MTREQMHDYAATPEKGLPESKHPARKIARYPRP
jgi:hypothetical protein